MDGVCGKTLHRDQVCYTCVVCMCVCRWRVREDTTQKSGVTHVECSACVGCVCELGEGNEIYACWWVDRVLQHVHAWVWVCGNTRGCVGMSMGVGAWVRMCAYVCE